MGKNRLAGKLLVFGATVRNRTADILITSEVLYQLSYGGTLQRIQNIVSFSAPVYDFLIRSMGSRSLEG